MTSKVSGGQRGGRGPGQGQAQPSGRRHAGHRGGRRGAQTKKAEATRKGKASPAGKGQTAQKGGRGARMPRGEVAARRAGKLFGELRRADGCGAVVEVFEHAGGKWEHVEERCHTGFKEKSHGRGAKRAPAGRRRRATTVSPRTCQALAAFGHPQRVKLLGKMLEGPATYRALQRVTQLKAGPLYHHINQLRLARLILPKRRDLYELTRGGRNLMLTAMAVGPLIGDARRRPVPDA